VVRLGVYLEFRALEEKAEGKTHNIFDDVRHICREK
jgi:hypothetical protein